MWNFRRLLERGKATKETIEYCGASLCVPFGGKTTLVRLLSLFFVVVLTVLPDFTRWKRSTVCASSQASLDRWSNGYCCIVKPVFVGMMRRSLTRHGIAAATLYGVYHGAGQPCPVLTELATGTAAAFVRLAAQA